MTLIEKCIGLSKTKLLQDPYSQEYLRELQTYRIARSRISMWLVFSISLGFMIVASGSAGFGGVVIWVALVMAGAYFRRRIYDQVMLSIENASAEVLYRNEIKLIQSSTLLSFLVGTGYWVVASYDERIIILGISLSSILYAIGSTLNLSVHFQSYIINLFLNVGQGLIYYIFIVDEISLFIAFALIGATLLLTQIAKINKDQFDRTFSLDWKLREQNQQLVLSEIELKQSLVREEKANRAKSDFIAATSHDLRQSMHSLGIFIGALSEQEFHEPQKQLIDLVKSSATQLNNKFNDIIEHSRFDTGVILPKYRVCSLSSILENATESFIQLAKNTNIKFTIEGKGATVYTDPGLIERILQNLIQNAFNHTNTGEIKVEARVEDKALVMTVSDSGSGIGRDMLSKVFEPHVQETTDDDSIERGSGLGLSIVKHIVQLLEGKVSVESEKNIGSVFTVFIPNALVEVNNQSLSVNPVIRRNDNRNGQAVNWPLFGEHSSAYSILILDDDKKIVIAMQALLETKGVDVSIASDYESAIQLINIQEFDLHIFDDMLNKEETGVDLACVIQNLNSTAKIIIITANDDRARLNKIRELGFKVLKKPVLPDDLISVIENISNTPV